MMKSVNVRSRAAGWFVAMLTATLFATAFVGMTYAQHEGGKEEQGGQQAKPQAHPAQQTARPAQQEARPAPQQARPAQQAAHPAQQEVRPAQQAARPAQQAPPQKRAEQTQPQQHAPQAQQSPQGQQAPRQAQQPPRQIQQPPHAQQVPQRAEPTHQQATQQPAQRASSVTQARGPQQPQRTQQQAQTWQQQKGWTGGGASQGHATFAQDRSQNWSSEHRTWAQRGGYGGYYIPQDRFGLYFGSNHFFRMGLPVMDQGFPRFQYGGFSFLLLDPYPANWAATWYNSDDFYIVYDNGYYLYDRNYPQVGLAIMVQL